jgi:hypothetical protein
MEINGWEYGIAIGVLSLMLPAFIGTMIWVIRSSIATSNKVQTSAVSTQQALIDANSAVLTQQYSELKDITLRLDNARALDYNKMIEEMHKLNLQLAELTGILTFILDHYIKTNGSK